MSATPDRGYELLVKRLLLSKLRRDHGGKIQAFHLKKYRGKSGQEHEIDVSFEITMAGLELLFLVECKHYARRVGLDDMMAFSFRLDDISANKGMFVTTVGFQAGAEKVASSARIARILVGTGGAIQSWHGATSQLFEAGMTGFDFALRGDGTDIELRGNTRVVSNQKWRFAPLDPAFPSLEEDSLTFLRPEDEGRLTPTVGVSPSGEGLSARGEGFAGRRLDLDDIFEPKSDVII